MVGKTLGHYEILEPLGAGGMGEVYRARDTTLDRDVAIKVLPEDFATDPERLARFEREAKLLASLNHANIATIHGLEDSDGVRFIAMELVEGETLAQRIARSARIGAEEALEIARQIAEALEAAHENGVIHRDLKPANVIVTPDGKVKVLDFGLAKAYETDGSPSEISPDLSHSPTMAAATRTGVILGTAAYMSPEQARGKPVDKRADIWAFGCVLYEMLTGRRAFNGETVSDTMAAILKDEPDWELLGETTPWVVRRLLRRCLAKDARTRLRDVGDARLEIDEGLCESGAERPQDTLSSEASPRWQLLAVGSLATFVLGALVAGLAVKSISGVGPSPFQQSTHRLTIDLPAIAPMDLETPGSAVAISPDGTRFVYVAARDGGTQLYVRPMDQFEATPIPGTEGGSGPFFSPDSQWVGFFAEGMLKKVSLSGGRPLSICEAAPRTARGASWGSDDTIIFKVGSGLFRVSAAAGATPTLVTEGVGILDVWPELLPGGKDLLFTNMARGNFDDARIALLSLETEGVTVLDETGTNPRYARSGHLVFARAGNLLAAPFDRARREITGPPVTVVESAAGNAATGSMHFSISSAGSLVYVPGAGRATQATLVWVDRQGGAEPLPLLPDVYEDPRLSPDRRRLAVTVNTNDIWIYEVATGGRVRLTRDDADDFEPIWMPDGKRVTFSSAREGVDNLFSALADGSGEVERLTTSEYPQYANAWSPDGRALVFTTDTTGSVLGGNLDTWVLRIGEGKPTTEPLLDSPYGEWAAKISPDGGWLTYVSNESGRKEVFVQPFPGPGPKIPISTEGGTEPLWDPKGQELFYRNGENMMAVAYTTEPTFTALSTETLFEDQYRVTAPGFPNYDYDPDRQRFLMIRSEQETRATQVRVILNWFEELKQRVPTGR